MVSVDLSTIAILSETAIVAVIGWVLSRNRREREDRDKEAKETRDKLAELDKRLGDVELKLGPFWELVVKEFPKFLIHPHTPHWDAMIRKYLDYQNGKGPRPTLDEAKELRDGMQTIVEEGGDDAPWALISKAGVNKLVTDIEDSALQKKAWERWRKQT